MDNKVWGYQKRYYDEICALPIEKGSYGIIHWDIHADNFFVNNGRMKLIEKSRPT
ncbi:hypothetical protein LJC20_01080 [Eubacteriales bacterium OttesenSCG-928-M02]|nr:hypothetical protein [Eubacteriales bacterium OttesenSCG-928-M02]